MKPTKKTKNQRIADLEQKLYDSQAQQIHRLQLASAALGKLHTDRLMGSAVVLSMSFLGGQRAFEPVAISDGLSEETIAAIRRDLVRSYEHKVELKPLGCV